MHADRQPASRLRIDLLGPIQVTVDEETLEFRAPMHRALLAILAIRANTVVSSEMLIDELWQSSPPDGARATLQSYVSVVRRRCREAGLGDRVLIETRQPGYVMHLQVDECDALELDERVEQARESLATGSLAGDAAGLPEAIGLFRGPVLHDLDHLATVRAFRTEVQERQNWAVERRVVFEIAAGNASDVIAGLRELVDHSPLQERLWALLIRALYHSGRQADALRAFQELRGYLIDELGVDPSAELVEIERRILDGTLDTVRSTPRPVTARSPSSAPHATTALFGRRHELASLMSLVEDRRLITIVGPGGSGKTRLAAEAAVALGGRYDEVAWVELVSLPPGADVVDAIAAGVGIMQRPPQGLLDLVITELAGRDLLLVLDNCEHVIESAAAAVDKLQTACPAITVLATSREDLSLPGEHRLTLDPLTSASPLALARSDFEVPSDAAAMFIDRAGFSQTPNHQLPLIEAICAQLDGIPLAIELTAPLAATMSLDDLADGLLDRFRFLADGMRGANPHHRTLHAVVDWSHELLQADERRAFMALSVFRGSFTLPAATAVIGAVGADARLMIPRLVRKSMVLADTAGTGGGRYHLLETLRAFGAEQLALDDHADAVHGAFVRHYLEVALAWNTRKQSVAISAWLAELGPDIPNLQAALSLARRIDEDAAIRIVDAFQWYLNYLGPMTDTRAWLDELRAGDTLTLEQRAMVCVSRAALANFGGNYGLTTTVAEDALVAARELGDPSRVNAALIMRGTTATFEGNAARAAECFVESAELSEQLGDLGGIAASMVFWGVAYRRGGDFVAAGRCFDKAFDGFNRLGDDRGLALTIGNMGRMAQQEGDLDRANELTRSGLDIALRSFDPMVSAQCGLFCGHVQLDLGNTARAIEDFEVTLHWSLALGNLTMSSAALEWMVLAGGADPERVVIIDAFTERRRNSPGTASPRPEWEQALAAAQGTIDADTLAGLTASGARMSLDDAIACAREAARS